LLENNGIPAFLTNENSNNLRRYGFSGMCLFVRINSQREEAIKLINNPNYRVIDKVDIDKYYEHINNAVNQSAVNNHIINTLTKYFVGLLIIAAIAFLIVSYT
ncbi:hypothetical protein MNBD_GAMMA08-1515, partial [hydrothermal vent metagenome]